MISYTVIGELILFFIGLPLFAFQAFEMFQALIEIFGEMAQYTYKD
jgi:hypothetical protein